LGYYYGPWIGAFQRPGSQEPAGGWTWVTGEPFSYSNWSPGQPDNNGGGSVGESYAEFIGVGGPESKWNDLSVVGNLVPGYIVEFDNAPPPAVSIFRAVELTWLALTNVNYQVQWSFNLNS